MVDLTKLRQKDRRPCYVLRIAGLPVLYGTHMPPALSVEGIAHARRASIIPDSISFSRRHDENARVVEVSNLEIVLASDEQYTADQFDPGKVFGRIGFAGADAFTRVTESIEPASGFSITVEDSSNFKAADLVHIGQESMVVISTPTSTTIELARGRLGTFARFHRVDADNGSFPYLTSPLVYFRGRRVIVYEGRVEDDGSVSEDLSDYMEIFRGFLACEPATAMRGKAHQVTLEVAPLTSVLDKPLPATTLKTSLHPNLHAFDGTIANRIAVHSFHETGQMWRSNCEIQLNSSGTEFQYLNREGAAADIHNRFDNDLSEFHPRGMAIRCDFTTRNKRLFLGPDSISTDPASGHLRIHNLYQQSTVTDVLNQTGGGANITGAFVELKSLGGIETKVFDIAILGSRTNPQVANWKHLLESRFNGALSPGTHLGLSGFHFDVGLDVNVGEVFVSPNFSSRGVGSRPAMQLCVSNSPVRAAMAISDSGTFPDRMVALYEVVTRVASISVDSNAPHDSSGVGFLTVTEYLPRFDSDSANNEFFPSAALRLDDDEGNPRIFHIEAERQVTTDGGVSFSAPICDSYLHLGNVFNGSGEDVPLSACEKFVVLKDSIGVAAGTTADVLISQDDEQVAMLTLSNETSVSNDGFSGFQYEIEKVTKYQDVSTIVDVPGEKRHVILPTIRPSEGSIGELLVKLLVSADGDSKTSLTHDVLTFGASLSDGTQLISDPFGADIDVESFLAIPNPTASQVFGPIYKEGDTLLETVEGLLTATGYTVDISTNSAGKCQLRAVELTLPMESDISHAFTVADISDKPTPSSTAELSIKNVFKFSANYNHDGEADVNLTIRDQVSIDLFKEAAELDVDLKGIKINDTTPGDAVHDLRPLFSRLRMENSFPRRVFSFDVPTSLLQSLALGDTCTVSHPLLRSASGLGVTTEPARVRSIEYDGYSAVGSVELVNYGSVGQSWNMAVNIVSIAAGSGGTVVNVSENEHSPTVRPSDGSDLEDSSGFHISQFVDVFSAYDMDAPVTTAKILDISLAGNQIQLSHSVSGLVFDSLNFGFMGFIVPSNFGQSGSDVRKFAFIDRTVTT